MVADRCERLVQRGDDELAQSVCRQLPSSFRSMSLWAPCPPQDRFWPPMGLSCFAVPADDVATAGDAHGNTTCRRHITVRTSGTGCGGRDAG